MGKTILNWSNGNNRKLPNYKNTVRKTTEEKKKKIIIIIIIIKKKKKKNYFDIDQDYLTFTRSYSYLLNILDIDLVPSFRTSHMNVGSSGIDNGP